MQTITTGLIKRKFIGVDDLRRDLSKILKRLPKEGEEIVITQHGQPQAVMWGLNTYFELQETLEDLARPGFIESIYKEVADVKKGKGITHKQLLKKLGI